MNHLAAATDNSRRGQGHDASPIGGRRPTRVQQWVLDSIVRRVSAYGAQPLDLSEEDSLAELLEARDLYSIEPKNIAAYDFDKVKILHRRIRPRPVRDYLPPHARGYYDHFRDLIERDQSEMEADRESGLGFSPHWGPKLKASKSEQYRLILRLQRQGLLVFRRRVKALAGIFTVKKKDGLQRLIIDARAACHSHRVPPKVLPE